MKPRRGRILIGLAAAAITATALVPSSSGAGRHHLVFRLSGPSRQNMVDAGAISISAHCPAEACTVVASATSANPSIRTAKVRAHVAGGSARQLTLPLAPRQSGKLRAALEAGKRPTLIVHATAHDSAGDKVPLSLQVHPVKP